MRLIKNLPVVLGLQELKLLLDAVQGFWDGELKRLTRSLMGRLKRTHTTIIINAMLPASTFMESSPDSHINDHHFVLNTKTMVWNLSHRAINGRREQLMESALQFSRQIKPHQNSLKICQDKDEWTCFFIAFVWPPGLWLPCVVFLD